MEQIDGKLLTSLGEFTLPQLLMKQAENLGSSHTAIRQKAFGIWQAHTWEDYLQYVKHVSQIGRAHV